MKREDFIQYLKECGCQLLREGSKHSVWINPATLDQSTIPRHREINLYTARSICKQLGIPRL